MNNEDRIALYVTLQFVIKKGCSHPSMRLNIFTDLSPLNENKYLLSHSANSQRSTVKQEETKI